MHSITSANNSPFPSNKTSKTIVILGNNEVGKTNILQRFTKRRFELNYIETIGTFIIFCLL